MEELTEFAKKNIGQEPLARAAEVYSKIPLHGLHLTLTTGAARIIMREAMKRCHVTQKTAESYAYTVCLKFGHVRPSQ